MHLDFRPQSDNNEPTKIRDMELGYYTYDIIIDVVLDTRVTRKKLTWFFWAMT